MYVSLYVCVFVSVKENQFEELQVEALASFSLPYDVFVLWFVRSSSDLRRTLQSRNEDYLYLNG